MFVCWGESEGKVTPSEFLKQHGQQNIPSLKGIGPGPTGSLFLSFYTFKIPTSFFCSPSPRDDISFPWLLCLHNFRVRHSFLSSNICLNKLLIKFFLVKPLAWIILSHWILTDNDKTQRKWYTLDDAKIREGFTRYMHFHWAMKDNFDVTWDRRSKNKRGRGGDRKAGACTGKMNRSTELEEAWQEGRNQLRTTCLFRCTKNTKYKLEAF